LRPDYEQVIFSITKLQRTSQRSTFSLDFSPVFVFDHFAGLALPAPHSGWSDCWLELQWVQTYSSTRSLCGIERSNTPAAQYASAGRPFREGPPLPEQRPSLAPVKTSLFQTKTQEPELRESTTKYNKTQIYQWE
jgi:hypothetical protein